MASYTPMKWYRLLIPIFSRSICFWVGSVGKQNRPILAELLNKFVTSLKVGIGLDGKQAGTYSILARVTVYFFVTFRGTLGHTDSFQLK
jgi:hypothetical protein